MGLLSMRDMGRIEEHEIVSLIARNKWRLSDLARRDIGVIPMIDRIISVESHIVNALSGDPSYVHATADYRIFYETLSRYLGDNVVDDREALARVYFFSGASHEDDKAYPDNFQGDLLRFHESLHASFPLTRKNRNSVIETYSRLNLLSPEFEQELKDHVYVPDVI